MKKLLILSLFLSLVFAGHAQVSQTVNVTAGGGLSAAITAAGGSLSTITNLTVTGTIDARDFVTMRDTMLALAVLDISGTTIAAYNGTGGTYTDTSYPANTVPESAFNNYISGNSCGFSSIALPTSLTSIGNSAFYRCSGLTTLTIPTSVTSIGDAAFSFCSGLTSITSLGSVTSIGSSAFSYCTGLTTITLPSSVTSIGEAAFAVCGGTITVDPANANYSSLNGVLFNKAQTTLIQCPMSKTGSYTIPSLVTSIGDYAFDSCTGLTTLTIPTSVTSIGVFAFSGCTGLTTLTIPTSVTSIRGGAFSGCSGLTSITIPTSVTSIGGGAFSGCTGLTTLTIPTSVTSIGGGAFFDCSGLTSITAESSVPVDLTASAGVFRNVPTSTCTLYVPSGSVSAYQEANQWQDFTHIVGFSATAISTATTSALKAYTQYGQLIVTGIPQGETLTVYTVKGTTIYSQKTDGNQVVVNLPAQGIYIVKAGTQSVKVVD